jgi:hypothetical protein
MKAKDAARIFNTLPDEVLVPVAQDMKSDALSQVLANMNSDNAKTLTVKLANKLALPQTTDAIAPLTAPQPTAPGPVAALTPAPAAAASTAAAPADQPAPVKRRVRKARPSSDVTASAAPATAPAAAPAAAPTAPAAPAAQATPAAETSQ